MNSTIQQIPPAAPTQPVISTGSVLTQVSAVLAVIILLILLCAWIARRTGIAPGRGRQHAGALTISDSVSVGQRERVVIVNVDNARLVLGVTAQQITHLHTLPPAADTEDSENNAPASPAIKDFRQLFHTLIKRSGKMQ